MDASYLKALPPHVRARVIGIGVETDTILVLGHSAPRDARLCELRHEARAATHDAAPYMDLQFAEVDFRSSTPTPTRTPQEEEEEVLSSAQRRADAISALKAGLLIAALGVAAAFSSGTKKPIPSTHSRRRRPRYG